MKLVEWNDSYSVGNARVDHQHHRLMDLMNLLNEAMTENDTAANTGMILDALVEYARMHFSDEESLIADRLDPGLLHSHQAEHDRFLSQVFDLQLAYHEGKAEIDKDVMEFLKIWLTKHIQVSDKAAMD